MRKSIGDWALAFFGMARELQEHRAVLRRLEARVRDLEEALILWRFFRYCPEIT